MRLVRPRELDVILPSCIAMFTEEVGVSPIGADGGAAYRARMADLIGAGRSFARIERRQGDLQGGDRRGHAACLPGAGSLGSADCRGRGHAARGMAAVVAAALQMAPVVTLYVNDFNAPARAAYKRVGFSQVGTFMSVLF